MVIESTFCSRLVTNKPVTLQCVMASKHTRFQVGKMSGKYGLVEDRHTMYRVVPPRYKLLSRSTMVTWTPVLLSH